MSEIQSVNDPIVVQFVFGVFGGLIVILNALVAFIFRGFKKDIEEIKLTAKENKKSQEKDHDRLDKIETKVEIYHPNP